MRPLLALVVVGVILGGLQLYMMFRPQSRRGAFRPEVTAAGRFDVEVTLTFDAGPDAFALDTTSAPSLLVQLRGRDVLRRTEPIGAGSQIVAESVAGIVVGANEFFVQATPQDTTALAARAVRVRVLRDGHPLSDASLWSEPGDVVQGSIVVDVPPWAATELGAATTNSTDGTAAEEAHDG
jgi:hypothetical protein